MSYNRLSGRIPDALYNASLSSLQLSNNGLTGPLSKRLFEMSSLRSIDLSHNPLNCTLPQTNITQNSMFYLAINGSGLIGNIPNLTNFANLRALILANNKLNGTIPASLATLPASPTESFTIFLNGNNLHGEIPDELYNAPSLVVLSLYSNNLTGTLKSFRGQKSYGIM
jgi:hypothetical protein